MSFVDSLVVLFEITIKENKHLEWLKNQLIWLVIYMSFCWWFSYAVWRRFKPLGWFG